MSETIDGWEVEGDKQRAALMQRRSNGSRTQLAILVKDRLVLERYDTIGNDAVIDMPVSVLLAMIRGAGYEVAKK